MFPFEIFQKNSFFCLFASNIPQLSVIFRKSTSRLPVTIFEALFGLDSLQGPQLTTNTKKVTHPCFVGKQCLGKKWISSKFETIRIFKFLRQNICQKHFESTIGKKGKNPKKSIFLIYALPMLCGISVNVLNYHDYLYFYFQGPSLYTFTRKLAGFCKMWMSTCSPSFRFFR